MSDTDTILRAIAEIGARLGAVEARLATLDGRFDTFEAAVVRRFDSVDRALRGIDERLTGLEDKIDRLSGVRFDPDRLLTGFARLRQRVDALEARTPDA